MFEPSFDKKAKLTIMPLAPLSMVSVLPGSYYRSVRKPTKHMICGILENMLDMHYSQYERNELLKQMQTVFKKKYKYEFDKDECFSSSGFTSILYPLINIELELLPITFAYDDLWTQHLKANDSRHTRGVRNEDFRIYKKLHPIWIDYQYKLKTTKGKKDIDKIKKEYTKIFNDNKVEELKKGIYPNFYQSPKHREFIVAEDAYLFKIATNEELLKKIEEAVTENNIAYLGTSEGWINVEIERL